MDFSSRNSQPAPSAAPRPGASFGPEASAPKSSGKKDKKSTGAWFKRSYGLMLIIVALLLAALVGFLLTADRSSEGALVDTSKMQAVFLQNDQVYFGQITELNDKYLVLNNIYYLQTSNGSSNSSNSSNNISLVKLGCELHRPYDRMVVNRDEVEFWENLQADGQVAKAVEQFRAQNPNGQKCSDTSGNTQNVQGAANTNNTANPTNNNNSSNNNKTTP